MERTDANIGILLAPSVVATNAYRSYAYVSQKHPNIDDGRTCMSMFQTVFEETLVQFLSQGFVTGFQGEGIIFGKECAESVFALEISVLCSKCLDHLSLRLLFEFQTKGKDNSSIPRTWEQWYLSVMLYFRPNTETHNCSTLQHSPSNILCSIFPVLSHDLNNEDAPNTLYCSL